MSDRGGALLAELLIVDPFVLRVRGVSRDLDHVAIERLRGSGKISERWLGFFFQYCRIRVKEVLLFADANQVSIARQN